MKKIIRYMQDQALQASNQKYSGPSYLSPREKEPQQRERHHGPSYHKEHISHHQSRSDYPSTASHSFPAQGSGGGAYRGNNGDANTRQRTPSPLSDKIQRDITRHQYAQDNILQSYELYTPELEASHLSHAHGPKYWILFIHGGYFRDDSVTSASFHPALSLLTKPPKLQLQHLGRHNGEGESIIPYVAGYASINYRLSPRPTASPQDPHTTSSYELRNAAWPDHIHDVLAAIAHLQSKYGFGERYLLVGHSVGATMALLSTLASEKTFTNTVTPATLPKIEPPMAVLGVSGIYDFELLHQSFADSGYETLTRNAIHNPKDDALASPARYSLQDYQNIWAQKGKKRRALILAHSRDDGLVDWKQPQAMEAIFSAQQEEKNGTEKQTTGGGIATQVVEMKGLHNDIWGHGTELAKVIRLGVGVLRRLEDS